MLRNPEKAKSGLRKESLRGGRGRFAARLGSKRNGPTKDGGGGGRDFALRRHCAFRRTSEEGHRSEREVRQGFAGNGEGDEASEGERAVNVSRGKKGQ